MKMYRGETVCGNVDHKTLHLERVDFVLAVLNHCVSPHHVTLFMWY